MQYELSNKYVQFRIPLINVVEITELFIRG